MLGTIALQQHDSRRRSAARGDDRRACVGDLSLARLVPELSDRLVDEAEAVRATLRELAAMRVHRKLAAERDAPSRVEPLHRLAEVAESETFQPGDRVEREAVVDEREID